MQGTVTPRLRNYLELASTLYKNLPREVLMVNEIFSVKNLA